MQKEPHEANRLSWNEATVAHNSHKGDQASFLRNGGSTLFPEEIELLGNISGLDTLHLQCNAGQDSLSLARLGERVTGVDISDEAIAFARQLSQESGIDAEEHDRQIQPSGAGADVRDVGHVRRDRIELAGKNILGNRQVVFAVGRMDEFALPDRL